MTFSDILNYKFPRKTSRIISMSFAAVTLLFILLHIFGNLFGFLTGGLLTAVRVIVYVLVVLDVVLAAWRESWQMAGFILSIFTVIVAFIDGFGMEKLAVAPYIALLLAILSISCVLLGLSSVESSRWLFIPVIAISVAVIVTCYFATVFTYIDGNSVLHIRTSPFDNSLFGQYYLLLQSL